LAEILTGLRLTPATRSRSSSRLMCRWWCGPITLSQDALHKKSFFGKDLVGVCCWSVCNWVSVNSVPGTSSWTQQGWALQAAWSSNTIVSIYFLITRYMIWHWVGNASCRLWSQCSASMCQALASSRIQSNCTFCCSCLCTQKATGKLKKMTYSPEKGGAARSAKSMATFSEQRDL